MACSGCGARRARAQNTPTVQAIQAMRSEHARFSPRADDGREIIVVWNPKNIAKVQVVGPVTKIDYGMHSGGSTIRVRKVDADARPDLFKPIQHTELEAVRLLAVGVK